jgi:hypothetical protein
MLVRGQKRGYLGKMLSKTEIVLLPASRLLENEVSGDTVQGLDIRLTFKSLEERGYRTRFENLNRAPLNPWAHHHPLWRAIDPIRASSVALRRRKAIALCCYESAALIVLLLRPVLRSPLKVIVFETGVPGAWRLRDRIMRFVVRRADAVLQVCSAQVDAVQAWEPNSAPGHFVFDAVDIDYFEPCSDQPRGPVVAVGDDGGRNFATFCTAVAATGVPAIAKTRMIKEDHIRYRTLNVLSQHLSRADYRRLLASASLVVVPLHRVTNASGVTTLLEAMALAKPVIIADSPGIRDYIAHEKTCLVVPCGDAEAMIAAIEQLRADTCLRRRLGGAARAFVAERCSPSHLAEALDRVICML